MRKPRQAPAAALMSLLVFGCGCDTRPASPPAESQRPLTPPATPAAGKAAADTASTPSNGATSQKEEKRAAVPPPKPRSPNAPAADAHAPAPSAKSTLQKATAGVGKKGRGYGGGVITEPARARFRIEEQIIFNNVDYALKLYKAQQGELPQTHKEFMEKIIRANQIRLPALPEGDEYLYDPEKGQLMVRHRQ